MSFTEQCNLFSQIDRFTQRNAAPRRPSPPPMWRAILGFRDERILYVHNSNSLSTKPACCTVHLHHSHEPQITLLLRCCIGTPTSQRRQPQPEKKTRNRQAGLSNYYGNLTAASTYRNIPRRICVAGVLASRAHCIGSRVIEIYQHFPKHNQI